MGKGEIVRNEQFLFLPRCFLKTCTADTKTPGLVQARGKKRYNSFNGKVLLKTLWEMEKMLVPSIFSHSHLVSCPCTKVKRFITSIFPKYFLSLCIQPNLSNQYFLLLQQCFPMISPFPTVLSTCFQNFLSFSSNLKLSSANSAKLSLGKGIKLSSEDVFSLVYYLLFDKAIGRKIFHT